MIRLVFSIQREIFTIIINNKHIWYSDRKFKRPIRMIPKDENAPTQLQNLFELTPKEEEEYEKAKTDEELADIIIHDCRENGAILLKKDIQNAR